MIVSIILGVLMIVFACSILSAVYYEVKGDGYCLSLGYDMGGGNKLNANCYRLVLVEWEE